MIRSVQAPGQSPNSSQSPNSNSFIGQKFIEHLLYAMHCVGASGDHGEPKQIPRPPSWHLPSRSCPLLSTSSAFVLILGPHTPCLLMNLPISMSIFTDHQSGTMSDRPLPVLRPFCSSPWPSGRGRKDKDCSIK